MNKTDPPDKKADLFVRIMPNVKTSKLPDEFSPPAGRDVTRTVTKNRKTASSKAAKNNSIETACKCRRTEVNGAGVQILGKCAASSRRFVMFVSIVMICPLFLGRTFITLNGGKVKFSFNITLVFVGTLMSLGLFQICL